MKKKLDMKRKWNGNRKGDVQRTVREKKSNREQRTMEQMESRETELQTALEKERNGQDEDKKTQERTRKHREG